MNNDFLVSLLLGGQIISDLQVSNAQKDMAKAQAKGRFEGGVVDWLLKQKTITAKQVLQAKAAHFGVEAVTLRIPDDVIAGVPANLARKCRVVPVERCGTAIAVAMADPSDLETIDTLNHLLKGCQISIRIASEEDIEWALDLYYPESKFEHDTGEPIDSRMANT